MFSAGQVLTPCNPHSGKDQDSFVAKQTKEDIYGSCSGKQRSVALSLEISQERSLGFYPENLPFWITQDNSKFY